MIEPHIDPAMTLINNKTISVAIAFALGVAVPAAAHAQLKSTVALGDMNLVAGNAGSRPLSSTESRRMTTNAKAVKTKLKGIGRGNRDYLVYFEKAPTGSAGKVKRWQKKKTRRLDTTRRAAERAKVALRECSTKFASYSATSASAKDRRLVDGTLRELGLQAVPGQLKLMELVCDIMATALESQAVSLTLLPSEAAAQSTSSLFADKALVATAKKIAADWAKTRDNVYAYTFKLSDIERPDGIDSTVPPRIFLAPRYIKSISLKFKARVIIHELAHAVLNAEDYKMSTIRKNQRFANGESWEKAMAPWI